MNIGNISTEMIQYQNKDSLPGELTSLIERIYQEIDHNLYANPAELTMKSTYSQELLKKLRKRFNLDLRYDQDLLALDVAAIYLPFREFTQDVSIITELKASTFVDLINNFTSYEKIVKKLQALQNERVKLMKSLNNKKGSINLKYAKVDGYFSTIPSYLIIDFQSLKAVGMTPREVTAVILHEVGHVFSVFENHFRLEKINLSLYNIVDEMNKNHQEKAEYIFKNEIATEDEFKEYLKSERTRSDMTMAVATSYLNKINAQIYNSKYLETVSESQADEFVTRFGLGKEIVSGLNKIYTLTGVTFNKTYEIYQSFYVIFMIVYMFGITLFSVAFAPMLGLILLGMMGGAIFGPDFPMPYDRPLDRFNRIRNSITNNLKNTNLPTDIVQTLLSQYAFVNEIIENSAQLENFVEVIRRTINPTSIEVKRYVEVQKKIENTLNNVLFVKSAQIKTFQV